MENQAKHRLLIIDDNMSIHQDFLRILKPDEDLNLLVDIESEIFGDTSTEIKQSQCDFEVDSAYQGKDGLEKVMLAKQEGNPYSLAFVDIRMPPGWDGIETIEHLWEEDPELQVVICSAYSDYTWSQISHKLGNSGQLLILKKPFENIEIVQMAHAMSQKCTLQRLEKRLTALDLNIKNHQHAEEALHKTQAELAQLKNRLQTLENIVGHIDNKFSIPLQDINDGTHLLKGAYQQLNQLITEYKMVLSTMTSAPDELTQKITRTEQEIDLDYLNNKIPAASQKIDDALNRLSTHIEDIQHAAHLVELVAHQPPAKSKKF